MSHLSIIAITTLLVLGLALPAGAADEAPPEGWFPFESDGSAVGSVFDAAEWLDETAGEHGVVTVDTETAGFRFADGTPVKFWGVNTAFGWPYDTDPEDAKTWARFLASYGVNAMRLHKFSSHGLEGMPGSTVINPEKQKGFDAFSQALREEGIYYGWSPLFGHRPREGDRDRLLAYDEIAGIDVPWRHLNASTSFLVYFADDLQDLHIELVVNMLKHVNPHTGMSYAEDPALIFIEALNEESVYWAAHERHLEQTPTYRKLLNQKFSDWLSAKYETQEALEEAWDGEGLDEGQTLAERNIYPRPNHEWFSNIFAEAEESGEAIPQHALDRAEFLYEQQVRFYERFVEAVRETGYKGPIITSCWQAGQGITHFYNLASDATIAGEALPIDRHNYFAGRPELAMVDQPGGFLLSTGMQQVANRPFQLSEWLSTSAENWSAEAAPLIAAYGMGLQGWDASYAYCNNGWQLHPGLQGPRHGIWNVDTPLHLGLYPVLSRMVHRGDVSEGEVISTRYVHVPSLREGKLGFEQNVEQSHDYKSFSGTVPNQALAIGRVVVEFTDSPKSTSAPDLSAYWDEQDKIVRSVTGELTWHYGVPDPTDDGHRGFVSLDTAGTQGVIGFAGGQTHELGDATLDLDAPFAVVLLTSLEQEADIADADRLLLTTMANGRDVEIDGSARLFLEPVALDLTLKGDRPWRVHVLDHHGHRTGETIEPTDGTVRLDSRETKAFYYEIER